LASQSSGGLLLVLHNTPKLRPLGQYTGSELNYYAYVGARGCFLGVVLHAYDIDGQVRATVQYVSFISMVSPVAQELTGPITHDTPRLDYNY
jgi:hypothetical protein